MTARDRGTGLSLPTDSRSTISFSGSGGMRASAFAAPFGAVPDPRRPGPPSSGPGLLLSLQGASQAIGSECTP